MSKVLFLVIAVLTVGCSTASVRSTEVTGPDRLRIIRIAEHELARRHAQLPRAHEVIVEETKAGHELEPPRAVYQVSFSFLYRGKNQIIYTVIIDRRTEAVEVFSDSRESIPSKV